MLSKDNTEHIRMEERKRTITGNLKDEKHYKRKKVSHQESIIKNGLKVVRQENKDERKIVIKSKEKIDFVCRSPSKMNISYAVIFSKMNSDLIYKKLEENIVYDEESVVKLFGKTVSVPRKQRAYGDTGLTYKFSGVTVKAGEWIPILKCLQEIVNNICVCCFNFVLVNRYKDGNDHMGFHKDNEAQLDHNSPIASLSFGQERDFVFKYGNTNKDSNKIPNVKLFLEHGSLLIMHPPTNDFWYHALPKRTVKACPNPRINLTFRKML